MMHGRTFGKANEKNGLSRRRFLGTVAVAPIAGPAMAKAAVIEPASAVFSAALRLMSSVNYGYTFTFLGRSEWRDLVRGAAPSLDLKNLEEISATLRLMAHLRNHRLELADLTADCLDALKTEGFFCDGWREPALTHLRQITSEGYKRDDISKILLEKSIPLIKHFDDRADTLSVEARRELLYLVDESRKMLDFDFSSKANRLAIRDCIEEMANERSEKTLKAAQQAADKAFASNPANEFKNYRIIALPPRRTSNASFFHIAPTTTPVHGFDIDRLLRKLRAPGGKTGSFKRHPGNGNPGLTISTNDAALIHFLNGCTRGNLAFPARPGTKSAALAAPKA